MIFDVKTNKIMIYCVHFNEYTVINKIWSVQTVWDEYWMTLVYSRNALLHN